MTKLPELPEGYYWHVHDEERVFGPAVTARIKKKGLLGIPYTVARGSGYLTTIHGHQGRDAALDFAVADATYLFRSKS